MKKFVLALLAVVLVLGLCTVAMAEEVPESAAPENTATPACTYGEHSDYQWKKVAEATCTQPAKIQKWCPVCDVCFGEVKTEGEANGHTLSEDAWQPEGNVICNADCYEYQYCSVCETKITRFFEYVPHDVKVTEVAATCLADGSYTETCKRCGEVLVSRVLPNPGKDYAHNFDLTKGAVALWDNSKTATCYADGYITVKCADCAATSVKNVAAFNHKNPDGTSALGTTYYPIGEDRDCLNGCTATKVCALCHTEVVVDMPALGHDWSAWQIDEAASCTEDGYMSRDCLRAGCRDEISNMPARETKAIEALGHDANMVVEKAATCTEAGLSKGGCARCATVITETIPATGHNWSEWTVTECLKTRTCENKGCEAFEAVAINCPADPETPADPDAPAGDDDENDSEGTGSTTGSGSDASIPATGDNTSNVPYIMMVAAVAGLVVLVASKRKVNC